MSRDALCALICGIDNVTDTKTSPDSSSELCRIAGKQFAGGKCLYIYIYIYMCAIINLAQHTACN